MVEITVYKVLGLFVSDLKPAPLLVVNVVFFNVKCPYCISHE